MKSGPQRFNHVDGEWVNGNGDKLLDMMLKDVGKVWYKYDYSIISGNQYQIKLVESSMLSKYHL